MMAMMRSSHTRSQPLAHDDDDDDEEEASLLSSPPRIERSSLRRSLEQTTTFSSNNVGNSSAGYRLNDNTKDWMYSNDEPEDVIVVRQTAPRNPSSFIVVGLLMAVIFLLLLALVVLLGPLVVRTYRRLRPVRDRRLKRRYETIERWLISKRVRPHDAKCRCGAVGGFVVIAPKTIKQPQCTLAAVSFEKSRSNESSSTALTAQGSVIATDEEEVTAGQQQPEGGEEEHLFCIETTELEGPLEDSDEKETKDLENFKSNAVELNECSICLEPFVADDIVSWSTNAECAHVYHHECIKEWLLRKAGCPNCRQPFLAVDGHRGGRRFTSTQFREWMRAWRSRMLTTYYCQRSGLVTVPAPNDTTKFDKEIMWESSPRRSPVRRNQRRTACTSAVPIELVRPAVKLQELEARRGSRGA